MCVVWSYLDADLVYSGGEDGTVRPWRPSIQQNRQPPAPGTLRIKRELNARLAIRQRADLFEANKISLTQGQSYNEREYYNGFLRMLSSWRPGNLQKGEFNRKKKQLEEKTAKDYFLALSTL